MLDSTTKKRIDDARDILVGKIPDPKSQVEQITIALIYKFMDDMDMESEELGGNAKFFVGEYAKYSWRKVYNKTRGGQEILLDYSAALSAMSQNSALPSIFHTIFKQAYLPYNDPETLKEFLKQINLFDYDHSEKLGDAFEYLLNVLGSQGDAGQFRTPRHIIDFMVDVVEPKKNETILDPACGTAGFLISAYKYILATNSGEENQLTPDERKQLSENIVGYDISPDMVRLSLVNMYLHRLTNPKISEYDTLTSDAKWGEYFDVILANPPFMSPKGGIKPHSRFSVQSKRSEALFVDYIAEHLTHTGRGAVIVPEGVIFKSDTSFKKLRKMLVDENYLYGVISLPSGVFNPYSAVKTSILLFDKCVARQTDKLIFTKVENDGFALGAQRRPIEGSQLPAITSMIKAFRTAVIDGKEFESDSCTLVEKSKIAEGGDYNLSGERYVEKTCQTTTKYPRVRLGDVFKTSSGGTPSKGNLEYYENGVIPWLRSGEVSQGYIYEAELKITQLGLDNSSAKIFPVNTVVIAMYGATAGQVGILKFNSSTNQAVCGIMPSDNAIPEYLFHVIKSQKEELIRVSTGGAQPNISQSIIKDIIIPLPSIEEQKTIVAEIESYEQENDQLQLQIEKNKQKITNRIAKIWGE
ncbi:MAG: N-6 DNA methylase [Rikenellaceae bacterium]